MAMRTTGTTTRGTDTGTSKETQSWKSKVQIRLPSWVPFVILTAIIITSFVPHFFTSAVVETHVEFVMLILVPAFCISLLFSFFFITVVGIGGFLLGAFLHSQGYEWSGTIVAGIAIVLAILDAVS